MDYLIQYFFAYPILSLVQVAFTIWMLVDSYRRQAEWFWFWVILWFQPLGAWIYFFVVKVKDFRGMSGHSLGWVLWHARPSMGELRYRADQTPTLANNLALAQRLIERQEHTEALPYLQAALNQEPDHCQVLYCLAQCHIEQDHPELALPLLDKILARDRGWSDYAAWRLLIASRLEAGDEQGSLAACRELARLSPTLRNRCLLTENLLDAGQHDEARGVIEEALEDHRFAPGPIRRRNWRWAFEARRLRKRAWSTAKS